MKTFYCLLFLFDIEESTKKMHYADRVEQSIFYKMIRETVNSVLQNINSQLKLIKSTGDGYYLYSNNPEDCLIFFVELVKAFDTFQYKNEKVRIRNGAAYGHVNLSADERDIFGDLANITARCCSNADCDELVITKTLYDLIASNTLFSHFNLLSEKIENPKVKGCEDVEMVRIKKKLPEVDFQINL